MQTLNKNNNPLHASQGMTLIEVLIALLLVTVTGFGVLSMVNFSTQEANFLKFEISADHLGRSLLTRAIANGTNDNKEIYVTDSSTSTRAAPNCESGCNNAEIAQLDIAEWSAQVDDLLPNARYETWWENNVLRLALSWKDPTSNNSALDCPFTPETGAICKVYSASVPSIIN